jgi:hypothetical protein
MVTGLQRLLLDLDSRLHLPPFIGFDLVMNDSRKLRHFDKILLGCNLYSFTLIGTLSLFFEP